MLNILQNSYINLNHSSSSFRLGPSRIFIIFTLISQQRLKMLISFKATLSMHAVKSMHNYSTMHCQLRFFIVMTQRNSTCQFLLKAFQASLLTREVLEGLVRKRMLLDKEIDDQLLFPGTILLLIWNLSIGEG